MREFQSQIQFKFMLLENTTRAWITVDKGGNYNLNSYWCINTNSEWIPIDKKAMLERQFSSERKA